MIMTTGPATVHSINVVHELRKGPRRTTAIDKRAVDGPIRVTSLGLEGDTQCDTRYHGGPDRAVYAYAREDEEWWASELDRTIDPGLFGENLTTCGLDVTGAMIGERWLVGNEGKDKTSGVVLEVRQPRIPCGNFTARMRERAWLRRFSERGDPGAYLKVIRVGTMIIGDPITIIDRPGHGVSIGAVFTATDRSPFERLLDSGIDLSPDLLDLCRRRSRS